MKKIGIILLSFFTTFCFFTSCETTSVSSSSGEMQFVEEYNRQSDMNTVRIPYYQNALWNLHGNMFSIEGASMEFMILNNVLGFNTSYNNEKFINCDQVVFYDADNNMRVKLPLVKLDKKISSSTLWEYGTGLVTYEDAVQLSKLLEYDKIYCYFSGDRSSSEFEVNSKFHTATKLILQKYFEINSNQTVIEE